jgi:hypothetical protein
MAICLPDEGMGTRALAREAVIRPLTDQPEVTEELLVTASEELGISRSLVYRASQNSGRQRPGFANRSGVPAASFYTGGETNTKQIVIF